VWKEKHCMNHADGMVRNLLLNSQDQECLRESLFMWKGNSRICVMTIDSGLRNGVCHKESGQNEIWPQPDYLAKRQQEQE
jgi:hypothetical protein